MGGERGNGASHGFCSSVPCSALLCELLRPPFLFAFEGDWVHKPGIKTRLWDRLNIYNSGFEPPWRLMRAVRDIMSRPGSPTHVKESKSLCFGFSRVLLHISLLKVCRVKNH